MSSPDAATPGVVGAPAPQLTPAARAASGRTTRRLIPRSSHAVWAAPAGRPDPAALLAAQETTRVAELVPLRHDRMLESPFAFYRGAAVIMANDLASTPNSGLRVQVCGDAHLANFGGFASPDRTMVFDINDFDETSHGPFEWDVKRLATSFEIAARARELTPTSARGLSLEVARSYRLAMAEFAGMTNLDVWYARLDAETVIGRWRADGSPRDVKRVERSIAKARSKDSLKAVTKLTELVDGEYRIKSDPPIVETIEDLLPGADAQELRAWLHDRIRVYRRTLQPDRRRLLETYRLVDFARKVVGVGSVGTRCWIALFLGKDHSDPLFLQIKEAEASVLEAHAGRSGFANHGQRVVEGQRLLQAAGDILLGWIRTQGLDGVERDFYVRQLWDWKLAPDLDAMSPSLLKIYAQMCGWTLARGHARSGDRIAISGYLGSGNVFDKAIAQYSAAYADQNQRDYEAVSTAFAAGARS